MKAQRIREFQWVVLPLCYSLLPMITQNDCKKPPFWWTSTRPSFVPNCCYPLSPNLSGYEDLKEFVFFGRWIRHIFPLSWKKIVSWRGSSDGSGEKGGESILFCLINLTEDCSHDAVFLKAFWFCLRKGESEPYLISLSLRLCESREL